MSDFIVNRAKQELALVFLEEFKTQLNQKTIYKDFFENTYRLLCDNDCENIAVENILSDSKSMHNALKLDMENFLQVAADKYLHDDAKEFVDMAMVVANGVERGLGPRWIFSTLRVKLVSDIISGDNLNNVTRGLYIIFSLATEYYGDRTNVGTLVREDVPGNRHKLFAYMLLAEARADADFFKQLNLLKENGTDMEPRKFELFWPKLQRLILILEKADLVADRIKKNQDVDHLKTVVDPASFISYALAIEDAIEFTSLLVEDNDAKKLFEDAKDKAVQAKIEVKRLENDLIDVVIQGQASIIAAWESARNEAKEAFAKADVGALSDSDRQASEEIKGVLKDAEEALDNLDDVFGKIIEVTTTLAATIKTSDKTGAAYGDAAQRFRELVAKYTEARGSVSDAIGSVEKAAKDKGSMSTIASALKTVNRVLAENILETAIAELRKATDNENSMRNDVHYNFYVLMRAVGFYNAIKSEDYNKAVVLTLATMKDYLQDSSQEDHVNGFHRDLHKYLAFTYNVASARDSKEVRKALEDAAMPVGGYRIKRKKDWTVTVNSYFGFVGGREKLQDVGLRDGYHFGPWVPVGLEVHFKSLRAKGGYLKTLSFISNNFEDGKIDLMRNFGLFVTIFDLGAIANYRLHNNEDENTESNDDPEVGFDQVFSPGIYYVNAVDFWQKKWQETLPASWGFGVQMTPRLRTVTEDGKETQANSLRFSFFIAMDIPIFTLY